MDRVLEVLVTTGGAGRKGQETHPIAHIPNTNPLSISPSVITFLVFSTFPPQKTVQGLVFKLRVLMLKHRKEKLHCKRLANQMPAHNFLLQLREFLEQYQKNAESA